MKSRQKFELWKGRSYLFILFRTLIGFWIYTFAIFDGIILKAINFILEEIFFGERRGLVEILMEKLWRAAHPF